MFMSKKVKKVIEFDLQRFADISNSNSDSLVTGTSENDVIENGGWHLGANGYEYDSSVSNVTIDAGDGNDSIRNWGDSVSIDGGAGNDSIYNHSGTSNVLFVYSGGNDTITGFRSDSTLKIDSGYLDPTIESNGTDLFLNIIGSGKITLSGVTSFTKSNLYEPYDEYGMPLNIVIETKINGTDAYDNISNSKSMATIEGGAGNDSISNTGNNVSISGGEGNDTLIGDGRWNGTRGDEGRFWHDGGFLVTLDGGAGDDEIANYGADSSVNGGDGADNIFNGIYYDYNYGWRGDGSNSKINGGADNDGIQNEGADEVFIDAGSGNDDIQNSGNKVTIDGSEGNDTITNNGRYYVDGKYSVGGSQVSINGGDGNDSIKNVLIREKIDGEYKNFSPDNSTLEGGAGNDTIENDGSNITIEGGLGDDSIVNYRYSGSSEEADRGGYNVLFKYTEGDGRITLEGAAEKSYKPHIEAAHSALIAGTESADNIANVFDGVTINALSGDDTVKNWGSNSEINAGDGNDRIDNNGSNVAIDGGSDNDTITSNNGDGNDIITGFRADSTLKIGDGNDTYLGVKSGNDIVLTVGEGKITLSGAASLKAVNIEGTEISTPVWTLSDTTATYGTWKNILITISGVKSLNGISLNGSTVTVSNAALNQGTVTISDGYTLALGSDVTKTSTTAAGWNLSGSTATYKNTTTTAGYSLANNQISYVGASGGETLATLNGVKSLGGISLNGTTVTIFNAALNQETVTISNGYTLALGSDVTKTSTTAANWILSGTTATYKNAVTTAGYKLDNNQQISYVMASGGETLAIITGVKATSGLSIDAINKKVTVSAATLGTDKITVSNGWTLALGLDVVQTNTTAANWTLNGSIATYRNAVTTAGYKLENNQISYIGASGGETLVTVSGVISINGLAIDAANKKVTVSASALGTDKVTVSNGYTLALSSDVVQTNATAANWMLNGSTATYKNASTSAGYKLENNQISYVGASGGQTLATVTGVKSTKGLALNGKVVTVSKASLGTSKVTIGKGYTLKLGSNVTKPSTSKAWSLSKTTATYKQTTTAGYTLANNAITYSKAASKTLATVKGVKSISGLSLKNKVVTVSKAALGTSKVTISKGYTLKLGSNVTKSSTSKAWSLSGSTATYKQSTTAGYTLADNAITYSKAASKTLVTVRGVKSLNGLSLKNKVVTVSKAALGTNKVTISNGYTLKLGSNVTKSSTSKAWNLSKSTATYKQSTTAGYALADNAITYSKKSTATLATVTGVKSKTGLSVKNNIVTLKNSALNKNVSVSGSYEFDFAKDYKNASVTGSASADTIKVLGSAITVAGGKGNDILTSSGKKNIFVYASGDGNDVIADFSATDKIKITNGTAKVSTSGADVVVKVGKGSIKLTGAAGQKISVVDAKGKETVHDTKASAEVAWFLEDDNNFSTDNQLDDLVESKSYLPTAQLDTSTTLTKENNFITYSGKK